jgi:hypothetical protein
MIGAGEGNRTLVISLEGCCSTIELHPHWAIPFALRRPSVKNAAISSRAALRRLRKADMPEGRKDQFVAQTSRPRYFLTLP